MSKIKSKQFIDSSDDSDSDSDADEKNVKPKKQQAEKRKSKDAHSSDSDHEPKKQKTEQKKLKTEKPSKKEPEKEEEEPKSKKVKNTEGNAEDGFDLGKNRKLSVSEFKGRKLVNIREYYEDAGGAMKPGRKGVCLTAEQWDKLLEVQDEVNAAQADQAGKEGWSLGKTKRISLNEFKNMTLYDIREYYTDQAGDLKPGKKGISLTAVQWNTLLNHTDEISDAL